MPPLFLYLKTQYTDISIKIVLKILLNLKNIEKQRGNREYLKKILRKKNFSGTAGRNYRPFAVKTAKKKESARGSLLWGYQRNQAAG